MTLSPSTHTPGELVLETSDHRALRLAQSLGGRMIRRPRRRVFLSPQAAEQFSTLYAAGFWPVYRQGAVAYLRDPKALPLYAALGVARQSPVFSVAGDLMDDPHVGYRPEEAAP
jgi:hypothetical protein